MPLIKMGKSFPDLVLARPEAVVDRPGLLFVQRVEGWVIDRPEKPWDTLLIYKSPLVTGTSRIYRAVAEIILPAKKQETLYHNVWEDPEMLHGKGICTMVRLDPPDCALERFPADGVQSIIDDLIFDCIRSRNVKEPAA